MATSARNELEDLPAMRFPAVLGKTLTGRAIAWEAGPGRPAILIVAFSPTAAADAERWSRWVAARFAGEALEIDLLVVVEAPAWLAPFIEVFFRGMRDPALRAHVITSFDPARRLRHTLGWPAITEASVYALDANGRIVYRAGRFSRERAAALARAVARLVTSAERT